MDDLNQIVPPTPIDAHRRPFNRVALILIIAVILVIAGLVYIGRSAFWQAPPEVTPPSNNLTDAQKAEILKSLAASPKTPPLTDAQKAEILKSLAASPKTPPLTDAQKAEILKSLR